MPKDKTRFDPTGEFAASITRYLIQKAQEALHQGVNASEGHFTWETFRRECGSLVQSIANKHPGGQSDPSRLARNNFKKQATKFTEWLASGRGKLIAVFGLVSFKI
jgi:hypothetical protein